MQIWAVGGGKGGTGKSLVANGLSHRLADLGHRVILVDLDFGGANQHTYCGIRRPPKSLSEFFENRSTLEGLALETRVPGMRLIPGNFNSPNTDSLANTQKLKLFRHLKTLQADHVILDLGAGTQYDTLDSFLLADIKVGVIAPDTLSSENFYLFVKNLLYRMLNGVLSQVGMRDEAREIWKHRAQANIATVHDFIEHLRTLSDEFSQRMDREMGRMRMHLALNQVREYRQVELGLAVKSAVCKFFRIRADFAGYIRYDKELWHQFGQEASAGLHPGASIGLEHDLQVLTDRILLAERGPEAGAETGGETGAEALGKGDKAWMP